MTEPGIGRRVAAEGLGSFFLFATVIGSGIMAANLSGGNVAVALLGNTLATGAILFVLIAMLGPISGAHMNPAVSLVAASRGESAQWSVVCGRRGVHRRRSRAACHLVSHAPKCRCSRGLICQTIAAAAAGTSTASRTGRYRSSRTGFVARPSRTMVG